VAINNDINWKNIMLAFWKSFIVGLGVGAVTWITALEAHGQEIPEAPADQYIEAQKQMKPTNCWPLMYTLEGIKAQGLNVLWQAKNQDDQWQNNQVLFAGPNNMWVLLEINDSMACVLGAGTNYILLDQLYKGDAS